jgi:hypothetical protein
MTNPFDASSHPKALINISTGMHATREIQESLTGAVDEGMKMLQSFVNGVISSRHVASTNARRNTNSGLI